MGRSRPQPQPLDRHPRRPKQHNREPSHDAHRLIAIAATLVSRSGRPTLRQPIDWPWANQFTKTLTELRALPAWSGCPLPSASAPHNHPTALTTQHANRLLRRDPKRPPDRQTSRGDHDTADPPQPRPPNCHVPARSSASKKGSGLVPAACAETRSARGRTRPRSTARGERAAAPSAPRSA